MVDGEESTWAPASGWAHLGGRRRYLSCVVYGGGEREGRVPYELLPDLSDTLTECGYPWEVILCVAEAPQLQRKLRSAWRDASGFRCVDLPAGLERRHGLVRGLAVARGDAIVTVDGRWLWWLGSIRTLVTRWELQGGLVCSLPDGVGTFRASSWGSLNDAARSTRLAPLDLLRFALVDRGLIEALL